MTQINTLAAVLLLILIFACLLRAAIGPTAADRVAAINVIGTKTMVLIALVSFISGQEYFLDVAIIYALISFVMTLGVARYLERGTLG
jgi:multicomponent Na+:H+ antiporter subunit F